MARARAQQLVAFWQANAGRAPGAGGIHPGIQPLTWDRLMDVMEDASIGFDDEGKPTMRLVAGSAVSALGEPTRAQAQRFNALLDCKREEYVLDAAVDSWLESLKNERAFDEPLRALLRAAGFYDIRLVHVHRAGRDFIAKRNDPDGVRQYAIQSKRGDLKVASFETSATSSSTCGTLISPVVTRTMTLECALSMSASGYRRADGLELVAGRLETRGNLEVAALALDRVLPHPSGSCAWR